MKVSYAIPVRGIETLQGGAHVLIGVPTDIISVLEFPAQVGVGLFVMLRGSNDEGYDGRVHSLAMEILGPAPDVVGERLEAQFHVDQPPPHAAPGWAVQLPMSFFVTVPAGRPGAYSIEIRIDGDAPYTVPIDVRQIQEPPA